MDIEENKEYENLKNRLLQRPITFLTEENLDILEDHCRKAIRYERGIEHKVVLELLERYKEFLAEREEDKKRIKELEEHQQKFYNGEIYTAKQLKQVEENQKKYFINKQKVKEGLEDIEDYFDRLNGPDEDIEYIRNIKKELLEDK